MRTASVGTADDEAQTARSVDRFDPAHRYTPALLGRCRVSPKTLATAAQAQAKAGKSCRGTLGLPVGFPSDGADQVIFQSAGDASVEALLGSPLSWHDREALLASFVDVLQAVAAMRAKGLVHMDLHAGNVVVDRMRRQRWRAKVIDFGWLSPIATAWLSTAGVRNLIRHPPTPFTDTGALARRALQAVVARSPRAEGGATALEAAASLDAFAVGAMMWRVLAHPAKGSQQPPASRRGVADAVAQVAAGLTHPMVRSRTTPEQAARELRAAFR